jgi:hypothetical protein
VGVEEAVSRHLVCENPSLGLRKANPAQGTRKVHP